MDRSGNASKNVTVIPEGRQLPSRWKWTSSVLVCLLLILFVVVLPIVQTYRVKQRVKELGGIMGPFPEDVKLLTRRRFPLWIRRTYDYLNEKIDWSLADVGHLSFSEKHLRNSGQACDHDLILLKNLRNLKILRLHGTQITGDGLIHIKTMTGLISLSLDETKITDDSLIHLQNLANLESLYFDNTQITDDGLSHLKDLKNLWAISMCGTKITDAGLGHLNQMTKLRVLALSTTEVTDTGLAQLKVLTKLGSLYLENTKITDGGLKHLKELSNLSELHLKRTKVTQAGVQELKAVLPKCQIIWTPTEKGTGKKKLQPASQGT